MKVDNNRRHYPRQNKEIPIQILFAPSSIRDEFDRDSEISANICNQSHDGFYIESDSALEPGSVIRIKIASPKNDLSSPACYVHDCQVVWHEKFRDRIAWFGIGVRILRQNVQANVLSSRFL